MVSGNSYANSMVRDTWFNQQANTGEWNGRRALTIYQQNFGNLDDQENHDLNMVHTLNSTSYQTLGQPDSTNDSVRLELELEELIRESMASTRNEPNVGLPLE